MSAFKENPFAELSEQLRTAIDFGSAVSVAATTPTGAGFVTAANAQPLGANTGAPPQGRVFSLQVGSVPVMLEGPNKQSRSLKIVVPDLPFGVFVGTSKGVNTFGQPVPAATPYEMLLVGYQSAFAVSNAPGVMVPVLVQVAPLLAGDREREWQWDEDEALREAL